MGMNSTYLYQKWGKGGDFTHAIQLVRSSIRIFMQDIHAKYAPHCLIRKLTYLLELKVRDT